MGWRQQAGGPWSGWHWDGETWWATPEAPPAPFCPTLEWQPAWDLEESSGTGQLQKPEHILVQSGGWISRTKASEGRGTRP